MLQRSRSLTCAHQICRALPAVCLCFGSGWHVVGERRFCNSLATPGCLFVFCAEARWYGPELQVLHSRLCRSFRMTVCCAAILRGVDLFVRVGSCAGAVLRG